MKTHKENMELLKESMETAVRQAGKIIIDAVIDQSKIKVKGYANYVTEIDFKVQKFIIIELNKIIPGCNIITEESNSNIFSVDKPTWVLDPVDGTTNLMYDYHHSAISLALFLKGKEALSIVYNPNADELFFAETGKGAYLNNVRIRVTKSLKLSDCLIGFGSTPYDKSSSRETFRILEDTYNNCRDIRRSGSAALDLAYVACGRIDGFFELELQPWDYAAGMLILKEAGGRATNFKNEDLSIMNSSTVLGTNGLIHEEMIKIIES